MNSQFLFAFNYSLETSDYYICTLLHLGLLKKGNGNRSSEMNEVEMILESFYR